MLAIPFPALLLALSQVTINACFVAYQFYLDLAYPTSFLRMGYKDEKYGRVGSSASSVSPIEPMSATSRNSEYLSEFEKKDLVRHVLFP